MSQYRRILTRPEPAEGRNSHWRAEYHHGVLQEPGKNSRGLLRGRRREEVVQNWRHRTD